MAREDGNASRPVDETVQRMTEAPYRFDFYQAMRLLESAFPDAPRFGNSQKLADEPVRLSQEPSLAFAPSSLSGFKPAGDDARYHQMSVRFFGLCGPNGALPTHLTEYVRDRMRHHQDHAMAAFLDIFHHRMLTLFYRAWADVQPTVHFDRPEGDRFGMYVGSLFGIGMETLRDRDELSDLVKLRYAGRLACQAKNPEGLRDMIADFFKLPCNIQEFIGQWTEIPENCRFYLGEHPESATLGVACTVGSHVWDCQQKFRLTIGPVDWEDFVRMLPGGDSLKRLAALVKNYLGDELLWDLNLVLRREQTPSWCLGEGKLGQSIWMDNAGVHEDPKDLIIQAAHAS